MLKQLLAPVRSLRDAWGLPRPARVERQRDRNQPLPTDPGIRRCVDEAMAWIGRAQDHSASKDGGVARHFSLVTGWGSSYPETTGYIIPTLLDYADRRGDDAIRERARRMVEWLVEIQLPDGGFQGGTVGQTPVVPVTFNTGQILFGLAAAVRVFGEEFRDPMTRAAEWLVDTQDSDGCWRRYPTPFAQAGEKTYETHVAWALLEAARVAQDHRYADAALANVRWALTKQRPNGWFEDCCLNDPQQPLTHTIGYALRGIVEAYCYTGEPTLLDAAMKTAGPLLDAVRSDGWLAGRLDAEWRGTVPWSCLTGSVQIASCWLRLAHATGDDALVTTAANVNRFVRRTVAVDGPGEVRGAVKGSFPVDGAYGRYEFLNWAAKFFIDANLIESDLAEARGVVSGDGK